ncbi:MAG: diacylglycerol kinase family lipid kinase [Candidatus Aminicenantes bacterium]|nr:diacylglycerol kinase family lipid kinase [Candidatus Aminicenantes bacterium]
MKEKKIAVLLNPSAGKGKAITFKKKLEHFLASYNIQHDLYITQSEENLRQLTQDLSRKYDILAAAGGDSTFFIMVNEIMRCEHKPALGLIGLGSSNDISREFHLVQLKKACRAIKSGRTRTIDLGRIADDSGHICYFLGHANIGLGTEVNRYVEKLFRKKPWLGKMQTLAGMLAVRSAYRRKEIPLALSVKTKQNRESALYMAAVFSNISFWATGRHLIPHARPDDGLLDACLIKDCSLPKLVWLNLLAGKERHVHAAELSFLKSQDFVVTSETPFAVQTDGEIIGGWQKPKTFTRISFEIAPRSLRIFSETG